MARSIKTKIILKTENLPGKLEILPKLEKSSFSVQWSESTEAEAESRTACRRRPFMADQEFQPSVPFEIGTPNSIIYYIVVIPIQTLQPPCQLTISVINFVELIEMGSHATQI